MTTVTDVDVVIAGGGPTGLLLACELALAGVTPTVLDSSPGPNTEPRANGVGGPGVRFLDHRGLYQPLAGVSGPPARWPWGTFAAIGMDLSAIPESGTYLLPVQQPVLTRTLADRATELGVDLRWGDQLSGFSPADEAVTVDVESSEGSYQIHAGYLVGADGGRSTTRKAAGIDFLGTSSNDAVFRLGRGLELPQEWRDPDTGGHSIPGYGNLPPLPFFRAGTGMFIWGQLENLSIVGTLELDPSPDDVRTNSDHPGFGDALTTAELEDSIQRVLGIHVPLKPVSPDSEPVLRRFAGINSRIAQRYRQGRVFLVGDAAHVHSPIGGPGLNLCLQDAANLGWKLANVLHGRVPTTLLDTYETERRLAAENVIQHSRAQLALLRPGPEITALRGIFGDLMSQTSVAQYLADTVSGTAVRYPSQPGDHRAVGYWVPDLVIDTAAGQQTIAQLAHTGQPLLLDFTDHSVVATALDDQDPRIRVVTGKPQSSTDLTAVLMRPDGYVAWASSDDTPDTATLERSIAQWFGVTR